LSVAASTLLTASAAVALMSDIIALAASPDSSLAFGLQAATPIASAVTAANVINFFMWLSCPV
jgi:hypothetical protein